MKIVLNNLNLFLKFQNFKLKFGLKRINFKKDHDILGHCSPKKGHKV